MSVTLNAYDKSLVYKALSTFPDSKKNEKIFLRFEDHKVSLCALKLIKNSLQKFEVKCHMIVSMMRVYLDHKKFSHAFELAQTDFPCSDEKERKFFKEFKIKYTDTILSALQKIKPNEGLDSISLFDSNIKIDPQNLPQTDETKQQNCASNSQEWMIGLLEQIKNCNETYLPDLARKWLHQYILITKDNAELEKLFEKIQNHFAKKTPQEESTVEFINHVIEVLRGQKLIENFNHFLDQTSQKTKENLLEILKQVETVRLLETRKSLYKELMATLANKRCTPNELLNLIEASVAHTKNQNRGKD